MLGITAAAGWGIDGRRLQSSRATRVAAHVRRDQGSPIASETGTEPPPVAPVSLAGHTIYKFLRSQTRTQGTWEQWPGDYFGSGRAGAVADGSLFHGVLQSGYMQ